MKCPACKFHNAAGIKFCGQCGQRLTIACRCGFQNQPGVKFCGECGLPLDGAPQMPEPHSDDDTRRREFSEARRLFLEIGAPLRADQAARELTR